MNTTTATTPRKTASAGTKRICEMSRSVVARQRMEGRSLEPLFLADWKDVAMLHFEVEADQLRRLTSLEPDLFDGRAFVSLVAFRMERMRLRCLPKLSELIFAPFTRSCFLNLRTYVRQGDDGGIQFLVEWLSNRLSVPLGPPIYGLPYRAGELRFTGRQGRRLIAARPRCGGGFVDAEIEPAGGSAECVAGSLEEFLAERYTAFTECRGRCRCFRIWHRPWRQRCCRIVRAECPIIAATFPELAEAKLVAATFSDGMEDVWMGKPERIEGAIV